jgi:hypothetical protein
MVVIIIVMTSMMMIRIIVAYLPTYLPIYLPTYHLLTYLRVGVSVDMSMSTLHLLYEVVGIGQIPIVCNRYAEGEVSVERLSFAGTTTACCGVAYMTQSDVTYTYHHRSYRIVLYIYIIIIYLHVKSYQKSYHSIT